MISDSEKNWVRHQHHQRREDAPVLKGLPFMVMYITGATRRLRNPDCKGTLHFLLAPRTSWRPCTVALCQSQVCPHLSMIRGWLDEASDCNMSRSLRTTLLTSQGNVRQRRHLVGQPGSQRGPLPHLQLGPLPGLPRGPHPAPQPGSSERVPMFRR